MSEKSKLTIERSFLIEEILPDSSGFFEDEPLGIEKAIENADVILDTNVLLIPYGAGQSSLTEIIGVYNKIKKENRLFIPAQVAREFVKNRPIKLSQLYQGISDQVSKLSVPEKFSYPILESVEEFNILSTIIGKIADLKKELKKSADDVRKKIKDWGWNDPVSQAYRPVFSADVVIKPTIDQQKTLDEMQHRYEQLIPPGYKDAGKPDGGIGDFLIWKTILEIGAKNKKSVIFVSGDEKADWLHGAEGSGFLPRFELQSEFRRMSEGGDLYIIPLSRLLELEQAGEKSVDEVKSEEKRIREASFVFAECPECEAVNEYELSENIGSSLIPKCISCEAKFHLHRAPNGIITRPFKVNPNAQRHVPKKQPDIVVCPHCQNVKVEEVDLANGWVTMKNCNNCNKMYTIYRNNSGALFTDIPSADGL